MKKKNWLDNYPELMSGIDIRDEDIGEKWVLKKKIRSFPGSKRFFSGQISPKIDITLHQFGYDFFKQEYPFTPEKKYTGWA